MKTKNNRASARKTEASPSLDSMYSVLMERLRSVRIVAQGDDLSNGYVYACTHFEDHHHTSKKAGFVYREFDFAIIGNIHWVFSKGKKRGYLADAYDSDILAIQIKPCKFDVWDFDAVISQIEKGWNWYEEKATRFLYDFSSSLITQMSDGSLAVSRTSPHFGIKKVAHKAIGFKEVTKRSTLVDRHKSDRISPSLEILLPPKIPVQNLHLPTVLLDVIEENLRSIEKK